MGKDYSNIILNYITSPKVKRVVGNALELSQNLRSGIIISGNIAGGNLSIILCN